MGRPSLPTHRHALENLLRLISVLNASARSSCSLPVRTRRTRIACPTLPLSSSLRSRLTSSRLRRPRRSLPSIWPSSERPSRSWKRPRREPSLLPHLNTEHLSGQLKLEENLSVVNRNIIQLLPQSENTEVATRCLQNPLGFLILRTYSSSSNLDVSFGFLCVSMTVLKFLYFHCQYTMNIPI